ncbi:hypothetical protein KDA_37740 [Dictyobacter alpinus]|uniref:Protein kinase domain-containing protein n=1 Tax=Dictyobacter alpinus TaxID=2014873 RepID=A0A402BAF1_9CHLR|nr:serine/threonine-protein kinase [Dictyobacter alpinus]GCE28290.1 hypothetical protein KDA_37740 [Dictyobacter alpinus]
MGGEPQENDTVFQKGQHFGQYYIIEGLNQGKTAHKYLVQSIHNKTSMVMEIFHPQLTVELKESFLAQAQVLMKLDHPHILRIADCGVENYYPFLITEYVPHLTFQDIYSASKKPSLTVLLPYLKQIASALQYAHGQDIKHGDIRPENVLLNRNNAILLQGFVPGAIMKNRDRLTHQGIEDVNRTIFYTAPEQIRGKAVLASDQYSLAVMVYKLLCGQLPFSGSYIEVANQQLHTPPPPLRVKVPAISARIERVIMTALAKNPAERFKTVEAFVGALEQEHNESFKSSGGRRTPPPPLAAPPVIPPVPISPPVKPAPVPGMVKSSTAPPPTLSVPTWSPPPVAPSPVTARAPQSPPPSLPVAPPSLPQPVKDSPLARRRDSNTLSRRVFAMGLVGLAALGGAGGWYVLSKRLVTVSPSPTLAADATPPAAPVLVNNKNVLVFSGHLASVNALSWSPDGKLIASASDDKFVQVWDAKSGKRKLIYSGHTEEVASVAWSPDGKHIVSGSQDGSAQVWDATTGKKLFTYKGHKDRVNALSWSSDSQQVASGSEDKTVQVWNAADGTLGFNFLGHTAGVLCVGWQFGNSSVASGSWDGTLRDWATVQHGDHFNAGDQIFAYAGHGKNEVYALSWSPDGNFIASAGADQTVQLSNGDDGTPRPVFFTGHQRKQHVNPVRSVAWSPDGNFIVSGDTDGNVYVWKVAGRKTVFTYQGHKKAVNAVAWSPDGKTLASASADNTVQVWQTS